MTIRLHNTLTRRKEDFVPLDPGHVRMYVCGPTVYDRAHIGNARPVVVFDVLYRLLRATFPRVTYVRNITDVDDKIINAARERGIEIDTLTRETTEAFHADMAELAALPPDVEPRATQHIGQMIAMIEKLVASGHAYAAEGHVLFNVPSMPEYGRLANRDRREMIAGARVEVAPYKKDPSDFVLWKPSTPDQPGWDSPWGRGRPGWHIECSAMSEAHLGDSFDIHGGGLDLIFPHHENEIAQSTCAHDGAPFVRYWLHNGYLTVNGEKMSKSLGNFFTVRELLDKAPGEAIRFCLLGTHYRQPLDWTLDGLAEAKRSLDRLYGALRGACDIKAAAAEAPAGVRAALEDDINTPLAIAQLHETATALNKAVPNEERAVLKGALVAGGALVGLLQQDPEAWFRWTAEGADALSDDTVEDLVATWDGLRKEKKFADADKVRDHLLQCKVSVSATPSGPRWTRVS